LYLRCIKLKVRFGSEAVICSRIDHLRTYVGLLIMPKLDFTHKLQRLKQRIQQINAGEKVAVREIKSLLSDTQVREMNLAWEQQQALRNEHRPKNHDEKKKLGWKTKKEVQLDALLQAQAELMSDLPGNMRKLQDELEAKAARVFLDAYFAARKNGLNGMIAGGNALTRAGYRNPYGIPRAPTKRDIEIREMETELRKRLEADMTDEEREEHEIRKDQDESYRKLWDE
jgi:hypothetical protein